METRALIMVADPNAHTMQIAQGLGQRLRRRGHRVDVADAITATDVPPSGYTAVIFGAEAGVARDRRALSDYIARHRERLSQMPTGLFFVAGDRHRDTRRHVEAFASAMGWHPDFYALLSTPKRAFLGAAAQHLLGKVLGALLGSKDVATLGAVNQLADSIANELGRSHAST